MEKKHSGMRKFGLIGQNIDYSFSKKYFSEKFSQLDIQANYENIDCPDEDTVIKFLKESNEYAGLNVTIPYKETVIKCMSELNKHATVINAVNVIKKLPNGKYKGYNTDFIGFRDSIKPFIKKHHKYALILGTGGASKAIAYALELMGIDYKFVSRNPVKNQFSYKDLTPKILDTYKVIINCTPLGTYPNIQECPKINFQHINENHLFFDLVYNPSETRFLKQARERGAQICNGYTMLQIQAEAAWKIW